MKSKKIEIILFALLLFFLCPTESASAASRKIGILVGNENGKYTWYDLNENDQNTENIIRFSANQTVMVPISLLTSYMEDLNYTFNAKTKKITLMNQKNGRKMIGKVNSSKITCYTKQNTKGSTKKMKSRIYIAKDGEVMISADALKYVMYQGGYTCKKAEDIKGFGYDTAVYQEIYIYNASASFNEIPKATVVKGLSNTVRVTIPEGFSVPQVFELLVDKGVCESTQGLFDACQNYSFNPERYPFLADVDHDENRCYRLEGYLFPNTYEFYRLCPPQDAIGVCLRGTNAKITPQMKERMKELNMTMDQVLTLASIVEKEGSKLKDQKMIASVLYNRLDKKMKLQVDATTFYINRYIKPYITGDTDRYTEQYSTKRCAALPHGPICNPGENAIMAALYPEKSNYFFFCSDKEGTYYYSETYSEHLAILNKLKETEMLK
ncbi:MAG: endolytic transglycosylase MltG [Clostridiales bacterium]|nr:endolytic transglycosylase MltG [Clostridiales bacterium]